MQPSGRQTSNPDSVEELCSCWGCRARTAFHLFAALSAQTLCKVINSCILAPRPSKDLPRLSRRCLCKACDLTKHSTFKKRIWHFQIKPALWPFISCCVCQFKYFTDFFFQILNSLLSVRTFLLKKQWYCIDFYCFSAPQGGNKAQLNCRSAVWLHVLLKDTPAKQTFWLYHTETVKPVCLQHWMANVELYLAEERSDGNFDPLILSHIISPSFSFQEFSCD